jgi:hypothetical protein
LFFEDIFRVDFLDNVVVETDPLLAFGQGVLDVTHVVAPVDSALVHDDCVQLID